MEGGAPLNYRFRRAVNAHGHYPTEQAALKVLHLTGAQPGPHRPPNRRDQTGVPLLILQPSLSDTLFK